MKLTGCGDQQSSGKNSAMYRWNKNVSTRGGGGQDRPCIKFKSQRDETRLPDAGEVEYVQSCSKSAMSKLVTWHVCTDEIIQLV